MERACELAGFFAAHAVWCVSDGEVLIPIFASNGPGEKRQMDRLVTDRLEDGVAKGRERLDGNHHGAEVAVLIHDGFVSLPTGRTDALLVDIRDYQSNSALSLAVPYRNGGHQAGFAVFRPKFLSCSGLEAPNYTILGEAFFRGVDCHEQGAAVWNKHLDQSK
jgi:hypothetical protein